MNERTFLQQLGRDERTRLENLVYDCMIDYARDEEITEDEIPTWRIKELAEGFVERGLGV